MKWAATISLPSNSSSNGQSCSAREAAARMAVTSMRSLGSRGRRMVMARDSDLARGILVPCICKTPCLDDRARHAHRLPMPGPLVAPEVGLEAWNRLEACRFHDVAAGHG